MSILYLLLSTVIIIVGLAGIFIPVLPGVPLVFAGTLVYAWVTGFKVITIGYVVLFALLTALASLVDYVGGLITARKFGASKYGLIGSIIGGIAGLVIFNIPGMLIGQLLGVIAGELYFGTEMKKSFQAGLAVFIGYLMASFIKVFFAGIIVIIFYFKVF